MRVTHPHSTTITTASSSASPAFQPSTAVPRPSSSPLQPIRRDTSCPPRRSARPYMSSHPLFDAFSPLPFQPYPLSNPHVQTILAHYYPQPPPVQYTRLRLRSHDAHAVLHVDVANGQSFTPHDTAQAPPSVAEPPSDFDPTQLPPPHAPPSPPVAVVLHGLESSSTGIVTRRIVSALQTTSFKVFVLNHRSCAHDESPPNTLRLYHAGFTDDLETLLLTIRHAAIAASHQPPHVYLAGFSLGANILCQFLAKHKQRATTDYGVVAAAAACVPFDLLACQTKLDSGLRGAVYSARLVSAMRSKFEKAVENGLDPHPVDPQQVRHANRIGVIDDVLISPVFGFRDRYDYYRQVESRNVLKHISVPTYIINSADDPFFDHQSGDSLPTRQDIGSAPILLHVLRHGGHCAFLDKSTFTKQTPGYFQNEFARYFSHIRDLTDNTHHHQ